MAEKCEIPPVPPEWFSKFDSTLTYMSTQIDLQSASIHSQCTEIKDLTAQIRDLCTANGMLEERIISAEQKASSAVEMVSELENTVASLKKENNNLALQALKSEGYSKKNNLKFYNISESPNESQSVLIHKLSEIFNIMGINLDRMLIDNIHRLPSSGPGPHPIIIKFCSHLHRDHVWSQRHLLRDNNIKVYVREHFNTVVESNIRRLNPIWKAALKADMRAKMVADKLTINGQVYTVDTIHTLPPALQPSALATRQIEDYIFFFTKMFGSWRSKPMPHSLSLGVASTRVLLFVLSSL